MSTIDFLWSIQREVILQLAMSQNYHISLNSGVIGIDKCVDIIEDLFTEKSNTIK